MCTYKLVVRYPTVNILIIVCCQMIKFLFSQFNVVFSQNMSKCQSAACSIPLLVQCLESKCTRTILVSIYYRSRADCSKNEKLLYIICQHAVIYALGIGQQVFHFSCKNFHLNKHTRSANFAWLYFPQFTAFYHQTL